MAAELIKTGAMQIPEGEHSSRRNSCAKAGMLEWCDAGPVSEGRTGDMGKRGKKYANQ